MQLPIQLTDLRPVVIGTEPEANGWHLEKLSDERLIEVQSRLMRLRQLGGPFADLCLSPDAETRMSQAGAFHLGS